MSYLVPCVAVQRTAGRQSGLSGSSVFQSKHDRLGTVSGSWSMDVARAAACSYMLVVTDGTIVDVGRIRDAEVVPERWTTVSEDEAAAGLAPIATGKVVLITAPAVPAAIESLIGQSVVTGRNPVRYVTVEVTGRKARIAAHDDSN